MRAIRTRATRIAAGNHTAVSNKSSSETTSRPASLCIADSAQLSGAHAAGRAVAVGATVGSEVAVGRAVEVAVALGVGVGRGGGSAAFFGAITGGLTGGGGGGGLVGIGMEEPVKPSGRFGHVPPGSPAISTPFWFSSQSGLSPAASPDASGEI